MLQTGKRYVAPSRAEVVVARARPGALTDGEVAPLLRETGPCFSGAPSASGADLQLGKRYPSWEGAVELLVTRAGKCDLRYDGEPMELLQLRQLPSPD